MVRDGYKETELGEIPQEWNVGPLSDILYVNPKASATNLSDPSEVSFLPMENVSESGRIIQKIRKRLGEVKVGYTSFKEEDVLFAKITPCMQNGKGALARGLINGVGFGSTEFHVLRAKDTGHPVYIYHQTLSKNFRLASERFFSGSAGQQRVSKDVFYQYIIPIPPFSEQRRIASVLSSLDEAIEKTEALTAKHRQVKAGLMQDLLTKGIDEQGRIRSEATHAFKDTAIGRVPVEWEIAKVGYEFEIKLGKMLDMEKNSGVFKPYIGNIAVQWNRIDIDNLPMMAMSSTDLIRFRLLKGDLLVCEGGEVGRAAIWDAPIEECYYQKALHRLRPLHNFDSRLMIEFLRYWLENGMLAKYISQSSIAHLTREKLMEVPLPVPSRDEQRRIATIFTAADDLIEQEETHRAKLLSMKNGLMADLLTGRVRVPAGVADGAVDLGPCAVTP